MRIWKILSYFWPFSRSITDGRGKRRRAPNLDILNESDMLEDRSDRSTIFPAEALSERVRPAEVFHVSLGHRHHQSSRTHNRFFRLSVVVVDYLLEHDWFSLLGGHGRRQAGRRRGRRTAPQKTRQGATEDTSDPTEESNRTVCLSDSPWSIVAAIERNPPDDSTTSEAD